MMPRSTASPIDLAHLSAALEAGERSPVHLLEECLQRIVALDPELHAFVTLDEAGATRAAHESEARQRAGRRLGPLDGIPVCVKDNLFVGGMRATWGSRLYESFVPPQDDLCVARLRRAGAVIVGKTNTPEFALGIQTDNLLFGATRNPSSPRHTPGGSSGGAAACIAAGMLPLAIGTDAGGSIRLPASFCGVVGFKPSLGRIPRLHGFPPMVTDFQVIGLMAASVDGLELAFTVMQGPDERDRASLAFAGLDAAATPARPRIGLVDSVPGEPIEPEVRAAVAQAADQLRRAGYEVVRTEAPYDLDLLKRFWPVLSSAGLARVLARFPKERHPELTPSMQALAQQGAAVTGVQYADALDQVTAFRADAAARFADFDLLLTPTTPVLPWEIGSAPPAAIAGEPLNARTPLAFCTFANATGYPALSLPWTRSDGGLPIGVQLVGRYGQDAVVLAVGREVHRLRPEMGTG